jgi:hypothetical protein
MSTSQSTGRPSTSVSGECPGAVPRGRRDGAARVVVFLNDSRRTDRVENPSRSCRAARWSRWKFDAVAETLPFADHLARSHLLRFLANGGPAFLVVNALVKNLPNQPTEPVGDDTNGLSVSEPRDEPAIDAGTLFFSFQWRRRRGSGPDSKWRAVTNLSCTRLTSRRGCSRPFANSLHTTASAWNGVGSVPSLCSRKVASVYRT